MDFIFKLIQSRFIKIGIFFILLALISYLFFIYLKKPTRHLEFGQTKNIIMVDNGLFFNLQTHSSTVLEMLQEQKIELNDNDVVFPEKETPLIPNMQIIILRAVNIKILVDGKAIKNYTLQKNISAILSENNISLGRLDKTEPNIHTPPQEAMQITITRINVEEKVIPEEIPFKTTINTNAKMGWQEKKITQNGENGIVDTKYRITYKNNMEVSRVILEKSITKESIPQIETHGTYMKLGGAAKGQGTWYSYMGGLFAASTTIPKGSYAKVTNTANGKSVVVQINDYGPQGKGRVIDLDKVAFTKIASLGAGVIGVKVEQILN